jgi:hypothetical protein
MRGAEVKVGDLKKTDCFFVSGCGLIMMKESTKI